MKLLSLLFLATLLLANSFNSPQEPPELQEASKLNESAVKLYNQGKYDEALPLARRAIEIREKLLSRKDPRVSISLTNLGEIYLAKKDYKAAREVFQRLLQIQEETFGPDDVNLAFTLDRLAVLHYVARNTRETEAAYKRALALREKTLGANDVQVADSLFQLGEFYRFERNFKPALESYRRALRLYGSLTGVSSREFERTGDGLACLGYDHHKPELFNEVTETWKQFAGANAGDEPEPAIILNGRALSLPKPDYPAAALERRMTGLVVVKVEIDESGSVISAADMCKGPPFLTDAALAAARKARFSPTTVNDQPVRFKGVIQYNFTRRFN
jgi:TonB family protein